MEQELPGKPILISPYLDARKRRPFGATPKQVASGFKALAQTGVGHHRAAGQPGHRQGRPVLADQRDSQVDERLRPVVGETTYGKAYYGSTRDYYREMALARDEMVAGGLRRAALGERRGVRAVGRRSPCAPQGTARRDRQGAPRPAVTHGRAVRLEDRLLHVERLLHLRLAVARRGDRAGLDTGRSRSRRSAATGTSRTAWRSADTHLMDGKVTLSYGDEPKDWSTRAVGWLDEDPLPGLPERGGDGVDAVRLGAGAAGRVGQGRGEAPDGQGRHGASPLRIDGVTAPPLGRHGPDRRVTCLRMVPTHSRQRRPGRAHGACQALSALVWRRDKPPFLGRWALSGGFIQLDEDLPAAAAARPRRTRRSARRAGPPGAAPDLRLPRPRPAPARGERRLPRPRPRPARPPPRRT